MKKLSCAVVVVGFVVACSGNGGSGDAGSDASTKSDSPSANDASTTKDAQALVDAAKNDASPTLVAQCQSMAQNFATLCAGDDVRPCLWNAYAALCASGQTQLLVDSMNCLDQTTCRTFSDPNEGETCLDTTHTNEESAVSSQYIVDTCNACGDSDCQAEVGVAEIFPYLTDTDITELAACQGNACDLDSVIANCAGSIPDVALFASCVSQ
jgi:hypothetical protein